MAGRSRCLLWLTALTTVSAAVTGCSAAEGGPVTLTSANAQWSSNSPPTFLGFGAEQPTSVSYGFQRSDQDDRRVVNIGFGSRPGATIGQTTVRLTPLPDNFDLVAIFATVEARGGRELRDGWARAGNPLATAI